MFDKIKNNSRVTFEIIEKFEERTDVKVEDCGMSGNTENLRWFVITDLQTRKEKNLYVKY